MAVNYYEVLKYLQEGVRGVDDETGLKNCQIEAGLTKVVEVDEENIIKIKSKKLWGTHSETLDGTVWPAEQKLYSGIDNEGNNYSYNPKSQIASITTVDEAIHLFNCGFDENKVSISYSKDEFESKNIKSIQKQVMKFLKIACLPICHEENLKCLDDLHGKALENTMEEVHEEDRRKIPKSFILEDEEAGALEVLLRVDEEVMEQAVEKLNVVVNEADNVIELYGKK